MDLQGREERSNAWGRQGLKEKLLSTGTLYNGESGDYMSRTDGAVCL